MKFVFSFLFAPFLLITYCSAQTVTFDVILFGNKIGYTNVTRTVNADGSETFILESRAKAKILWITRENQTNYEVVYKSGKLISSKTKEIENGKLSRWTNVMWDGKKYLADSYKGRYAFSESPVFSIVSLYFNDIKDVKRIFYESEADFGEIKTTGEPDTWEFKSSDGNRNVYHFKNGKLNSIDLHASIATVRIVRTN